MAWVVSLQFNWFPYYRKPCLELTRGAFGHEALNLERVGSMYQEDKTFNLRFCLEAQFSESYSGEDDNFAWLNDWETRVKPDLLKIIFSELRKYPSWSAHVRNRGMSAGDEVEIALVKLIPQEELE